MSGPHSETLDGRYRLLEIVGEGGMAVVWRAEDAVLERIVAIKVLRAQYAADPEFLERFRSEARSAAALNHPGVVGVYDVGRAEDQHYLSMEYVPGADLKARLREGPVSTAEAVRIASSVARAVGHAHDAGLVHRDVKPQNVLIAPDGRVKVTDFGIARAVASVGVTAPGIVLGTVHYLSPEQASGQPASPASDVYSLGVVLYEMLAGRVPHDADSSVGVAMKIAHEEPPPIDSVNPRVPAVLAAIVGKAMARLPEDRYATAGDLADALEGFARWSEQATGNLVPVAKSATGVAPAAEAGFGSGLSASTAPADLPLLDGHGVLLALVALAAVAGLIPLWSAVLTRVDPERVQSAFGFDGAGAAPPPPPIEITATPPATGLLDADVAVPEVRGLEEQAATLRLRERGLGVSLQTQESMTVTAGIVLDQLPPAVSGLVPAGTVVSLTVSGEPLVTVPDVGGGYEQVRDALLAIGLEPVRRNRWGGGGAEGAVLSVDPPAGSRLPRNSPVHITVNSGSWLPLGVDFQDHIHLSGVQLASKFAAPGQQLGVVARWEATGDVEGDYRTVAELLGPGGDIVSRDAHKPPGDRPTSAWVTGDIIFSDAFNLIVPPDAGPGSYTLILALERDDDSGGRVPIVRRGVGVRSMGDGVVVMAIEVAASEP